MKDEVVKLEEIEASHTIGGYRRCRCYSDVRYTIVSRSHRISCRKVKGLVVKKTMDLCGYESEDHEDQFRLEMGFYLLLSEKARAKEKTYMRFSQPNMKVYFQRE